VIVDRVIAVTHSLCVGFVAAGAAPSVI
jgi:hypothetical protein